MTITRVEFINFRLSGGPSRSGTLDAFKPKDHPKWTVREEGPWLYFEGEEMRLKVPAARCVVHYAVDAPTSVAVEGNKFIGTPEAIKVSAGNAAAFVKASDLPKPEKRKPGRPSKPKAEEPDPDIDPEE